MWTNKYYLLMILLCCNKQLCDKLWACSWFIVTAYVPRDYCKTFSESTELFKGERGTVSCWLTAQKQWQPGLHGALLSFPYRPDCFVRIKSSRPRKTAIFSSALFPVSTLRLPAAARNCPRARRWRLVYHAHLQLSLCCQSTDDDRVSPAIYRNMNCCR